MSDSPPKTRFEKVRTGLRSTADAVFGPAPG